MNNTALKWLRDSHEYPWGHPMTNAWLGFDLTPHDPLAIGILVRGKGMAYGWEEGKRQQWSWRQMLAAFNQE